MYKSPIEAIYGEVKNAFENGVLTAVQNCDIHVDKNELIRALQYDREQYEKGYADGVARERWTPCSEKMPMGKTEVLVCDKDGFLSIAEYALIDGEIWWRETTEYRHIEGGAIAWMPLPRAWKGKEE